MSNRRRISFGGKRKGRRKRESPLRGHLRRALECAKRMRGLKAGPMQELLVQCLVLEAAQDMTEPGAVMPPPDRAQQAMADIRRRQADIMRMVPHGEAQGEGSPEGHAAPPRGPIPEED